MKTASVLLLLPVIALAQEESVPVSKIPPAIASAVSARFPDGRIVGAAKETEDGKTFFEVTIKLNGKNVDVTAMQSGELTLVEREISRKDLPTAVTKLLDANYPKAKYHLVEDVSTLSATGENLSYFEVQLTDSKKQLLEVQVALDGSKIIKVEPKKPGDPN